MSDERVERRLAAILAADVAGYSRLMGANEEGTLLANAGWFVFTSIAPMIGPVTLPDDFLGKRTWVIVAGEQGPHDRCRDMAAVGARAQSAINAKRLAFRSL